MRENGAAQTASGIAPAEIAAIVESSNATIKVEESTKSKPYARAKKD